MKCYVYDIEKQRDIKKAAKIEAALRHIDYIKQLKQQTALFNRVREENRLMDYI